MRWAVIGDVGGRYEPLCAELRRLGADPDRGRIPDDLTIVQVGDLVHRGPASEYVVGLVARLLANGEGRWIQLAGNHEAQYLRAPAFRQSPALKVPAAGEVRSWWHRGQMQVAAVVPGPGGDMLVTHAGLTRGFWSDVLGCPTTARKAADALNALARANDDELFRPGVMLTGRVDLAAGPLWAEASRELVASWLDADVPFGQIHGHSTLLDWDAGRWLCPSELIDASRIDAAARHATIALGGVTFVSVDPWHHAQAAPTWRAWVSEG